MFVTLLGCVNSEFCRSILRAAMNIDQLIFFFNPLNLLPWSCIKDELGSYICLEGKYRRGKESCFTAFLKLINKSFICSDWPTWWFFFLSSFQTLVPATPVTMVTAAAVGMATSVPAVMAMKEQTASTLGTALRSPSRQRHHLLDKAGLSPPRWSLTSFCLTHEQRWRYLRGSQGRDRKLWTWNGMKSRWEYSV